MRLCKFISIHNNYSILLIRQEEFMKAIDSKRKYGAYSKNEITKMTKMFANTDYLTQKKNISADKIN